MKYTRSEKVIVIICSAIIALMAISLSAYYIFWSDNGNVTSQENVVTGDESYDNYDTDVKEENVSADSEKEQTSVMPQDEEIDTLLDNMSLTEKVYQMFFVTLDAAGLPDQALNAEGQIKNALSNKPVGGLIFFSSNIKSRDQILQIINAVQNYTKTPLFIGIDEEGGRVARLGNAKIGVTTHPPMREIGNSGDPSKAYEVGVVLGTELSSLGFNVDFAPVADVLVNSNNTEIGDRSFGDNPENVSDMVSSLVRGLEENNVSSVLKHFPGHGSTSVDSHTGYSESSRTLDELRKNEFLPFKSGIDAGADFVMISHMTPVNAINEKVPASLSKEVITDMLKNELGFNGIVITDSFSMGAITDNYSAEEAAVKTVLAGADMILMPGNLTKAHTAIVNAVNDGKISESRIDESVRKILAVKMKDTDK